MVSRHGHKSLFWIFYTGKPSPLPYHSSVSPLSLQSLKQYEPLNQLQDINADSSIAEEEEEEGERQQSRLRQGNKRKPKLSRTLSELINAQPWSPKLELALDRLISELSPTTVVEVVERVNPPSKSLRFFQWVRSHKGFSHTQSTYFKMIEILGRSRNLNAAHNLLMAMPSNGFQWEDKFFNSLMRSYAAAGLFKESIKLFLKMKELGVPPSVYTFNTIFLILLRRGRTNMVRHLYDEMLMTRIEPDVFTFNILIRGFCLNSMIDEGFRLFNEMVKKGCEPDVVTYNTLLDGLCRSGKVEKAHNLMKAMKRKGKAMGPNVVSYTTLIRAYCEKQMISDALELFDEMVEMGLKPNEITYNTLIQGLCEARKLDKIKEILKDLMDSGDFKPDTCTFNTLITAHCNGQKLDEAMSIFSKLSELGVKPDSATYSILIRNLCLRGEFEKAEAFVDDLIESEVLVQDVGCVPLVASYNQVLEHLCSTGKAAKAERLFRQLLRRGTQDPVTFKTLIIGQCKEGRIEAGYDLLVFMLRRDFVPDPETYGSLITGFMQKGDPVSAHKTLEKMLKSEHVPKTTTLHQICSALSASGHVAHASSVIRMMIERRIRQNIGLSTDVVVALFKNNRGKDAMEMVSALYENGYSVKFEKVVGLLIGEDRFVEAQGLMTFGLKRYYEIDAEAHGTVISGLCKIDRVQEAFSLFYELIEKGGRPSLPSMKDLAISLQIEGKSREAVFVSRRMVRSRWMNPSREHSRHHEK